MSDDPIYLPLSSFRPRKINWLWPYYLGSSILTVMDGDPGLGKSFLAMHIAAQFSIGGSLPGVPKLKRRRVLYLTREDDPAFTIRPRIDSMGGDPDWIQVQSRFSPFDEEGMKHLREAVQASPPGLIVIDPLYSFVGADADIYRPNEIRQALAELQEVAELSGAALLAIRHLRKMKADKAIYQGAGAIDVIGVARCGLLIAEDPDDPSLRVVAHSKHNLSRKMESLTYRLVDQGDDRQPRFEWVGTSSRSADELVNPATGGSSARDEAKELLRDLLSNGERPSQEVLDAAEDAGISPRTLKRAKTELGVVSRQSKNGWLWRLK